jgi:hypothetical protein
MFADPAVCTAYYNCDYFLQDSRVVCPSNTHFDTASQACQPGNCSSSNPLPFPALTPTTNPTTHTRCKFNYKPNKPKPSCSRTNETFPYPADCHKYYRCDKNLNLVSVRCLLDTTGYDHVRGGCYVGVCLNHPKLPIVGKLPIKILGWVSVGNHWWWIPYFLPITKSWQTP